MVNWDEVCANLTVSGLTSGEKPMLVDGLPVPTEFLKLCNTFFRMMTLTHHFALGANRPELWQDKLIISCWYQSIHCDHCQISSSVILFNTRLTQTHKLVSTEDFREVWSDATDRVNVKEVVKHGWC